MTRISKLEAAGTQPHEGVIRQLEDALQQARSGDLRSVVIVGELRGHRYYATTAAEDRILLLGLLQTATADVMGSMIK